MLRVTPRRAAGSGTFHVHWPGRAAGSVTQEWSRWAPTNVLHSFLSYISEVVIGLCSLNGIVRLAGDVERAAAFALLPAENSI